MNTITSLNALHARIPRRHNDDNVKEIKNIIAEYEDILITIEAINPYYEKNIASFFDTIETIKTTVKNSTSTKASKKGKDDFFDDASGALKDSMQDLIHFYGDGKRTV
jgi:hypothetical protein